MAETRQKLVHLHSAVAKVPTAAQLNYGEIAVQYDSTAPVLYIKDSSDNIVKFIDETAVKALLSNVYTYKGSKATYSELPATGNTVGDVWNVVAANGNIPAGTNYAWTGTEWDSLGGSVDLSTYITNDTFTAHTSNSDIHVTTAQTASWDAKQDAFGNEEVLSGITAQQVSDWDEAAASAHTHDNIDVLTGITSQKVSGWDEAAASAHTHDNIDVLTGITSQKVSSWDEAAASAHTHDNIDVLDDITSAKTEQWDSAYTVSQNALVGIDTGKDSGVVVNTSNNKLDFSGISIDCGSY